MTNADRIRNMSDEELAKFIQKREYTCFVDFMQRLPSKSTNNT